MKRIAVFLGELQLDSQRKVLEGIINAAVKDGNSVFVYSLTLSHDDKFNEGEVAFALNDDFSIYDGFILYAESIYSSWVREQIIEKIKPLNKPCASIDNFIPGMINVSSDTETAMNDISRHLIHHHGIKTVNFISGPVDSLDAMVRKSLFSAELEKAGLVFDEKRCYYGDFYARSGRKAIEYYEENGLLEADAYVCANDQMALGAYYALAERDIKVPEDTLLSGYDNIFEAANHYPRITSVNRSEEKIGEITYRNIYKAIMGEPHDISVTVKSEAIFAESCGCELRRPVSHRIVVNQYAKTELDEMRYAELVGNFSIEMTNAQNNEDINAMIKKITPELGGDSFHFTTIDANRSNKKLFLRDVIDVENTSGDFYIISSLHYREKLLGMTVICNSRIPFETEFYRLFNISLSNALERVEDIAKMQQMIKTLDEMWVFDPMTRVYNRAGFFKFAGKIAAQAKEDKDSLFFIFLDIDGLKQVNDIQGHEMGDKMICEMADILRKTRDKEDLLMRYGGDEFVVFGRGLTESEIAGRINTIRKAMNEVNSKDGRTYQINASIGYHIAPYNGGASINELIELADQNMYKEKREKHKNKLNGLQTGD